MGHDDIGFSSPFLLDILDNLALGSSINSRQRIIQNQEFWLSNKGTRNRNPLLLPTGNGYSPLANGRIQTICHPRHILFKGRRRNGLFDLFLISLNLAHGNIFPNRP